jgi:hypothetical protein
LKSYESGLATISKLKTKPKVSEFVSSHPEIRDDLGSNFYEKDLTAEKTILWTLYNKKKQSLGRLSWSDLLKEYNRLPTTLRKLPTEKSGFISAILSVIQSSEFES